MTKMEKQFQDFFDKLKMEMEKQTNELKYSVCYTNTILNRIDEKLNVIVEGIKQWKPDNATVTNNFPEDTDQEEQEGVSQQDHQSPAPVAEVSEGSAAKKTTSKRAPIKRKAPTPLAKKKTPVGKTSRRLAKKRKEATSDEDSDGQTASEVDSTSGPEEDRPQTDGHMRENMKNFFENINLQPVKGKTVHPQMNSNKQLCLDRNVKRNIRKFKGYEWAIGSSEYEAKLEETAMMKPKQLRSLLFILDLNIEGSVEEMAKQLVDFVQRPMRNQYNEDLTLRKRLQREFKCGRPH